VRFQADRCNLATRHATLLYLSHEA